MAIPGPLRSPMASGLLAALLVAGCGPTSKLLRREILRDGAGTHLRDVPFVRQRRSWCGPAALASVARFHGLALTQEQVAREVYLPSIGASLTIDLARCARGHGLWCHSGRGSLDDARAWLDRGLPVLALLQHRSAFARPLHYVVLTGYHARRGYLLAHTGHLSNRPISFERFARQHADAGRWLLVACPPERVDWPLDADGHNELGLLFERAGKLARAAAEYRRAIAVDGANAVHHFNLGNVLARRREPAAAERAYREAIARQPAFADAHNNLAELLLTLGRKHEAYREARRAVTIDGPRAAYYHDTLGRVLLALGRHAHAAHAFRTAIAEAGDDPAVATDARLGLIEALVRAGDRAAAAAEKSRVLATAADPAALRPRLDKILE